ncbi:MAG TPA: hypothetical protein DCP92_12480 [Nitrospiraceae bacterium]|nr:hypothetical protein [Nitrospiraceae bacterium]
MTEGKICDFTASMMSALSNCALYSEKHPIVNEFSVKAFGLLQDLYKDESVSITLLSDTLLFNDNSVTEKGIHFDNFMKKLRRKGIEKIEIRRGVTIDEFKKFVSDMASQEPLLSSPHISVGIVEVQLRAEESSLRTLLEENISKVKDTFCGVAYGTELDLGGLERAVVGLISTLKQQSNVLGVISSARTYNEYTYVHAANVSLLTMFQAETFGMSEETTYDIGLAGLLHDIGKLSLPIEVLDKQTKLDLNEWNLLKLHPVYGARYLSTLPDVPKLALIVAFEHHMNFDGSGYPDVNQGSRRQHPISQMVAISDFFDALRTERPYRKSLEVCSIVKILNDGAGKYFNPELVDNFVGALSNINVIEQA